MISLMMMRFTGVKEPKHIGLEKGTKTPASSMPKLPSAENRTLFWEFGTVVVGGVRDRIILCKLP